jgi:hypothetical protein
LINLAFSGLSGTQLFFDLVGHEGEQTPVYAAQQAPSIRRGLSFLSPSELLVSPFLFSLTSFSLPLLSLFFLLSSLSSFSFPLSLLSPFLSLLLFPSLFFLPFSFLSLLLSYFLFNVLIGNRIESI